MQTVTDEECISVQRRRNFLTKFAFQIDRIEVVHGNDGRGAVRLRKSWRSYSRFAPARTTLDEIEHHALGVPHAGPVAIGVNDRLGDDVIGISTIRRRDGFIERIGDSCNVLSISAPFPTTCEAGRNLLSKTINTKVSRCLKDTEVLH